MSVSANVIKQVCAIDHFIGKYSFLLINQFIKRVNFLIKENIPRVRLLRGENNNLEEVLASIP